MVVDDNPASGSSSAAAAASSNRNRFLLKCSFVVTLVATRCRWKVENPTIITDATAKNTARTTNRIGCIIIIMVDGVVVALGVGDVGTDEPSFRGCNDNTSSSNRVTMTHP